MSRCIDNLKENLLCIMWEKDYTILEMSVQCDISMSELEKIIAGNRRGIRLSTVERISDSLEIPIADLIRPPYISNLDEYTKEKHENICRLVSMIDDLWILDQMKRFIINMTKGTKYEQKAE